MAGRVTLCIFCFEPCMAVKVDKKGRPYMACLACNTRIFIRGQHHLHGYAMAVRKLLKDPAAKREWLNAAVAIERGVMGADVPAAGPVEAPVSEEVRSA